VTPSEDGTFKLEVDEVGGLLRVTRKVRSGHGWMYINPVRKRDLTLAADADLVLEEGKLVSFKVRLPKERLTSDLAGVAIFVKRGDKIPMSWLALRKGPARQAALKTGVVEMQFVPGKYTVMVMHWAEGTGWKGRRRKPLGTITITKDSAGKVLVPVPLEEEKGSEADKRSPAAK
jgi:hypothetical protein